MTVLQLKVTGLAFASFGSMLVTAIIAFGG
jgi:hypothetical protein